MWRANDASVQENISHMMPSPDGTADTRQDGFIMFTQNLLPCYQHVVTEPRICQIKSCSFTPQSPTLLSVTHCTSCSLLAAVEMCISFSFCCLLLKGSTRLALCVLHVRTVGSGSIGRLLGRTVGSTFFMRL